MKLTELSNKLPDLLPEHSETIPETYGKIRYPAKILPMLKMDVTTYEVRNWGTVMRMNTSMMGMMRLSTFSFTPSSGKSVPYLLIDLMSMGKKRLAYIEFYDCRADKTPIQALEALAEKYKTITDYQEKPAWYVQERMKGSLIKCASAETESQLSDMVTDAVSTYFSCSLQAGYDPRNLSGLSAFAERMISEGNPSSPTLNKVLGKEKAEDFFRALVMPVSTDFN